MLPPSAIAIRRLRVFFTYPYRSTFSPVRSRVRFVVNGRSIPTAEWAEVPQELLFDSGRDEGKVKTVDGYLLVPAGAELCLEILRTHLDGTLIDTASENPQMHMHTWTIAWEPA